MRFDDPDDAVYAMWRLRTALSSPRSMDFDERSTAGVVCDRCAGHLRRRNRKGKLICAGCNQPWVGVRKGFPKVPAKTYARPADYDRALVWVATIQELVDRIPEPESSTYIAYLGGVSLERIAAHLSRAGQRVTRYQVEKRVETARELLGIALSAAGLCEEEPAA